MKADIRKQSHLVTLGIYQCTTLKSLSRFLFLYIKEQSLKIINTHYTWKNKYVLKWGCVVTVLERQIDVF